MRMDDSKRLKGPQSLKKPLRFTYLWTGGKHTEVALEEWQEVGAYVHGRQYGLSEWQQFQKLRMWNWHDDSYLQLEHYAPRRSGAPRGRVVRTLSERLFTKPLNLLRRLMPLQLS